MKVRTSISLSESVLKIVDQRAKQFGLNRSAMVETAVRAYLDQRVRDERSARDVAIISANAERLNREAADVIEYQFPGEA